MTVRIAITVAASGAIFRGGNTAKGGDANLRLAAGHPITDEFAAGILRTGANEACIAQHGFDFLNARGARHAADPLPEET
jgi:hypothetical protein